MGKKFNLQPEAYEEGTKLFAKKTVTIEPGVTVLVGCNGAGKTTMLRQIKGQLKSESAHFHCFDNHADGDRSAMERYMHYGNTKMFATMAFASEGERIMTVLSEQAANIGSLVRHSGSEDVYILMDAVDSGFSIDNVDQLKELLFETAIEDHESRGGKVYIIVTANSYEMARGEDCIDVISCNHIRFADYEEYRSFIIDSSKKKEERP